MSCGLTWRRVILETGAVVLAVLVITHAVYATAVGRVKNGMLEHPRDDSRVSLLKRGKATAFPSENADRFEFQFQRLESCPDRIEWRWGRGEVKDVQFMPNEIAGGDCAKFTARNRHDFIRRTPRRVWAVAYLHGVVIAYGCTNFPDRQRPCDENARPEDDER